jgi:hypothetical protein
MKKDRVAELLIGLEFMREQPQMFFQGVDAGNDFLRGFAIGAGVSLNLKGDEEIRGAVTRERGWPWSSLPPWNEMRQQGLDDAAIVHEMLSIEIEVWQRIYDTLDQNSSPE